MAKNKMLNLKNHVFQYFLPEKLNFLTETWILSEKQVVLFLFFKEKLGTTNQINSTRTDT